MVSFRPVQNPGLSKQHLLTNMWSAVRTYRASICWYVDVPRYDVDNLVGLTPTSRSDVSKLYESTNTVNENISSVTSLRDGGDSQLLGAGIAVRFVS